MTQVAISGIMGIAPKGFNGLAGVMGIAPEGVNGSSGTVVVIGDVALIGGLDWLAGESPEAGWDKSSDIVPHESESLSIT